MKIALVNKEFDASYGGGEVYATNLARGLIARGDEVTLVTREVALDDCAGGFEHIPVECDRKLEAFARAADAAIAPRRDGFDVIHSMTQFYPSDIYRVGGGVFRHWEEIAQRNRLLRELVRLGRRNRRQRRVEAQIYAPGNYRLIQTNSRLVKGQVMRHYGVPEDRVVPIHNGVDLETFRPDAPSNVREELGIPADAPMLLFVGSNIRRKGLDRLGRAMAHVDGASKVWVVIVGYCKQRKVEKAMASHPGPWKWVGGQRDVAPYYAACDVFLIPTRYDPFANVTLEALASGTPVITSPGNGAGEVFADAHPAAGEVVTNPDDPSSLAAAIDRHLAGRGGEGPSRARELAERYPWSRNLEGVLALYDRVVAEKRG